MDHTRIGRRTVLAGAAAMVGGVALGGPRATAATTAATTAAPWPARRGDSAAFAADFGAARHAQVARALRTGDPLADAVVVELRRLGTPARLALQAGIKNGLATLTSPPPAVAAFLKDAEAIAGAPDPALLDRGARAFFTIPVYAHAVALSLGSLVHTYSAPIPAQILVNTDKLIYTAERRLLETSDWLARSMLPGGLRRGGRGYVATLQVRMFHAQNRARALASGWDVDELGTPLCQMDFVRTWLDFTYVAYRALDRLGFPTTPQETGDIYRMWWTLGALLGIDPAFYRGITTHEEAGRLVEMVDRTNEPADANSKQLVKATLDAVVDMSTEHGVPRPLARDVVNALTRMVNTPETVRFYEIPASALPPVLEVGVETGGRVRELQRALPDQWENQIRQNIKDAEDFLATRPPSSYQAEHART